MKVSAGTIARTAALAVTLLNSILTMFGKNPLPYAESDVYNGVSTVLTVLAAVAAWWKNNSFSNAAITADEVLKGLKNDEHKSGQTMQSD